MASLLSRGVVAKLQAGDTEFSEAFILKVTSITSQNETKYRCAFTDGADTIKGAFATQVTPMIKSGELSNGAIVKIQPTSFVCNAFGSEMMLMVTAVELVQAGTKQEQAEAHTPGVAKKPALEDASARRPAHQPQPQAPQQAPTPGGGGALPIKTPSPGSAEPRVRLQPYTPPAGSSKPDAGLHKIAALHPYSDQWSIKAKVTRKYPVRTVKGDSKVMSLELVDDQGTPIQATMWRQAVDRFADGIGEERVYVFSRFTVKPSNRAYSTVKNDYEVHLDNRSEVFECEDSDAVAGAMVAALDLVPVSQLLRHVGRKAPVDVLGIVLSVGQYGSIKRKTDESTVYRRDVTLGGIGHKSVVLTLWGDLASSVGGQLEGREGCVLQVTGCKVTDYAGCSLSSLQRSAATLDPQHAEAAELRDWYSGEGKAGAFVPVGEGQPGSERGSGGAGGAGGAATRPQVLSLLREVDVPRDAIPPVDAKPTYHTVHAALAYVKTDTTMFYLANPENGKKVVEQEGRYWCEGDGKYVDSAEHRYVLLAKVADFSGEMFINALGEQGTCLLGGLKADDLARLKDSSPPAFGAAIDGAKWGELVLTLQSRSREYNGELRMRHQVTNARPVDFAADGAKLLELIGRYN